MIERSEEKKKLRSEQMEESLADARTLADIDVSGFEWVMDCLYIGMRIVYVNRECM